MQLHKLLAVLIMAIGAISPLSATLTIRDGKVVDADTTPEMPVENHFNKGIAAYHIKDWEEAIHHFLVVTINFPNTSYAREGYFRLGASFYYESEFEESNEAFTNYIRCQSNPEFFEEAMTYKLSIANAFTLGAKRHVLGYRQMPKWFSANDLAEEIYEEVAAAMPSHNLAAQALFSKGSFHWMNGEYRESVESYQTLIKRFPKHSLSAHAYSQINKIYLEQCQKEFQNPDLLALADLNQKKFQNDFPGDNRILESETDVLKIKETYAKGLYETGMYYEKSKQSQASIIYYQNAVQQFPETQYSQKCRTRLRVLHATVPSNEDVTG